MLADGWTCVVRAACWLGERVLAAIVLVGAGLWWLCASLLNRDEHHAWDCHFRYSGEGAGSVGPSASATAGGWQESGARR